MLVHGEKPLRWIIFGLCIPIVTGCAALFADPAPPPIYYVLTTVPEAENAGGEQYFGGKRSPVVGVDPVNLPDYLDTPQIVVRTTRNTLERSDFHHWGAPLENNFTRVLTENLSMMIPTDQVTALPGGPILRTDFQIAVDVSKFERDADGLVVLVARWALFGEGGRELITMQRSIFRQPAPAGDYDAIAAALSTTVGQLSAEIAAAITSRRRVGV